MASERDKDDDGQSVGGRLKNALADRYRIEREIGSGGMATVYLAEDLRHHRNVAVKVLSPDLGAAIGKERFLREIETAANLNHPHILPLHDSGEADGFLFYVMPYVKGESLRAALERERQLPVQDSIRYTREIADALAYAHDEGIIHRDVKPANILLEAGHAVLMDFGIAQAAAEARDTRLTQTGVSLGTPFYMSPEQVTGEGSLDSRADQYALACVLFEMLMGEPPFTGATTAQILAKKLSDSPATISSVRSSVDVQLDQIIGRALETVPADRYPSMGDFGRALADPGGFFVTGGREATRRSASLQPTVPDSDAKEGKPWARKVASMLLLGVVIFGGGLLFLGSTNDLNFQSRDWILIADFQNNTGQPVFDRSLDNALAVGIQQSNHVNVFPKTRVTQTLERMLREDTGELPEDLAREVALRENIRLFAVPSIDQVDQTYVLAIRVVDTSTDQDLLSRSERAEGANDVLPALDRLARGFRRDLGESRFAISRKSVPLGAATTPSLEALEAWSEGDFHWGVRRYDEALVLLKRAVELDSTFAMAHADLAGAYYFQGHRESGDFHAERALSYADGITERERLWITAELENNRGNYEEAIEAYNIYLTRYPDDMSGWFRTGYAQMREGRYADAILAFDSVVAMDPENAGSFINLATCQALLNHRERAAEHYLKAFELAPAWLTSGNLNHEYGFNYVEMGRFQEGEEAFRKMLDGDDDQRALGNRSLALMRMYQGRFEEAREHLREAILLHHTLGSQLSEMRNRLYLASALFATDSVESALKEMEAVVALADSASVAPSWLANVGKLQARNGLVADAELSLQKAEERQNQALQGDQGAVAFLRGEVALAKGDPAGAVEHLRTAQVLRENASQLESLAFGLSRAGDLEGALDILSALLDEPEIGWEIQEFWIASHVLVGEIYEELGDLPKARESYEALLELWGEGDPDLVAVAVVRGRLARLDAGGG